MGISCCAVNCSNRFKIGSDLTFHRFPLSNVNLTRAWIHAIRRTNFVPTKHHALCSNHFTPECFLKGYINRRRLADNAVPSLFDFPDHLQPKRGRMTKELDEDAFPQPPRSKRKCKSTYRRFDEEPWAEEPKSKIRKISSKGGPNSKDKDSSTVHACSAMGCKERYVKGGQPTFHRFPRDPKRRKEWVLALKRKNFSPSDYARICSKHFTVDCFSSHFGQDTTLKKNAVPTIFNVQRNCHNRKKIFNSSDEEANQEDIYSETEYLLTEFPTDIKEEPLNLDDFEMKEDALHEGSPLHREQQPTVWLPQPQFITESDESKNVSALDKTLQPVVWLPRLQLTNNCKNVAPDMTAQATSQKLIPESGVSALDKSLQPVVSLPRLPLTNKSTNFAPDSTAQATSQKVVYVPESGTVGESITLANGHLNEGVHEMILHPHATGLGHHSGANATAPMLIYLPVLVDSNSVDRTSPKEKPLTNNIVPAKAQVNGLKNTDVQSDALPTNSGPTIVSCRSVAKLVQKPATSKPKQRVLPSSTVEKESKDSGDATNPPMNMVFVKVVETWDSRNETTEPQLCVIETTSMDKEVDETTMGVTSWMMTDPTGKENDSTMDKVNNEEGGEEMQSPAPALSNETDQETVPPETGHVAEVEDDVSECDSTGTELSSGEADVTGVDDDPSLARPVGEASNATVPNLLLVGPLSHSEEKLADLHSQLVKERTNNTLLQQQLSTSRKQKAHLRQKVKILQQKLRRLQNKFVQIQLGRGINVPDTQPSRQEDATVGQEDAALEQEDEDDFTWSET